MGSDSYEQFHYLKCGNRQKQAGAELCCAQVFAPFLTSQLRWPNKVMLTELFYFFLHCNNLSQARAEALAKTPVNVERSVFDAEARHKED